MCIRDRDNILPGKYVLNYLKVVGATTTTKMTKTDNNDGDDDDDRRFLFFFYVFMSVVIKLTSITKETGV